MTTLERVICPSCGATNIGPHDQCLLCQGALTQAKGKARGRGWFGRVVAVLLLILLFAALKIVPDWLESRREEARQAQTPLWKQWEQRAPAPDIPKRRGFKDLEDSSGAGESKSLNEIFGR